jgi:hypothetical protein
MAWQADRRGLLQSKLSSLRVVCKFLLCRRSLMCLGFADGPGDAIVIQAEWRRSGHRKRAGTGHTQSDFTRIFVSEREI